MIHRNPDWVRIRQTIQCKCQHHVYNYKLVQLKEKNKKRLLQTILCTNYCSFYSLWFNPRTYKGGGYHPPLRFF